MKVQTLISTMHLKSANQLVSDMNLANDFVIVNQCDTKKYKESGDEHHKIINVNERGLSKSRNLALEKCVDDIALIADDDIEYVANYERTILNGFKEFPDADIIAFYLDSEDKNSKKDKLKKGPVLGMRYFKIASCQIALKVESIRKQGIKFDDDFGSGSKYLMGEENILLSDLKRKGLKIYSYPVKIGTVHAKRKSTWFKKYDETYFKSRGAGYYRISKFLYWFYILQFAIRKKHLYNKDTKFFNATRYMFDGALEYKKSHNVEKPITLKKTILYLTLISFLFGRYNIQVGFSLKPFMIMGIIDFIYLILTKKLREETTVSKIEKAYLGFFGAICISSIFAYNFLSAFRLVLGIMFLIFVFLQFKILLLNYKIEEIKRALRNIFLFWIFAEILFYILGLFSLNFTFTANTKIFNVMVDRKIPRLISSAYDDPNFAAIWFSFATAFFLSITKKTDPRKYKIINFLCVAGYSLLVGLTMSRGGLLGFAGLTLSYLIFYRKNFATKILVIIIVASSMLFAFIINNLLSSNSESILSRVETSKSAANMAILQQSNKDSRDDIIKDDFEDDSNVNQQKNTTTITKASANSQDGETSISPLQTLFDRFFKDKSGSGRVQLWQEAIDIFSRHPITGIGINNTKVYKDDNGVAPKYTHNTYLDVIVETGLIGTISYIILLITMSMECYKLRKYSILPILFLPVLLIDQIFLSIVASELIFIEMLILILLKKVQSPQKTLTRKNTDKTLNQTKKEKVSIIMPVFNIEKYLEKSIKSVLSQKYNNFELLLIDDGSTDGSRTICEEFKKIDNRVKVYHKNNGGLSDARNYGLRHATGKYVWFVDGDDYIESNALEILSNYFGYDIVKFSYNRISNNQKKEIPNINLSVDPIRNYIIEYPSACLRMFRRDLLIKNNILFEKGKFYEDLGTIPSLAMYTDKIAIIDYAIYNYVMRENSIMTRKEFCSKKDDRLWAIDNLIKKMPKKYYSEIEYLAIEHLILSYSMDIFIENKKIYKSRFKAVREYMECNFPNYLNNRYLKKKKLFTKFYVWSYKIGLESICKSITIISSRNNREK